MADQEFRRAEEALPLSRRVINEKFSHLASARVEFVFFKKAKFTKGKEIWGYAKLVSGENSYLSLLDEKFIERPAEETAEVYRSFVAPVQWFCIFLSKEVWDRIDEKCREALIAHELCHCWVDENGDYSLLPHDLEEFNSVVKWYGLWAEDVKRFMDAANGKGQADLFEQAAEYEGEPAYQNVLPMPPRPRELNAGQTNALSTGSTAMPGSEPRQLGAGLSENHTVRCPQCQQFSLHDGDEAIAA